ncbi:MAG: hypothetical protein L3J07_03000 [Candidatus Magasanikbacteria bacterium]|nr:hypothetical protein [Candidatus Magasanikbacteria bacterium]
MMLTQDKREELRHKICLMLCGAILYYKTKGQKFFFEKTERLIAFVIVMDSIKRLMIIGDFNIRDLNVDYEDFVTVKMFAEMIERNIKKDGGGNE